tara:strand:+ start:6951 stop:7601 length:651 start_codon:yes stop_codon:yes gene_type:complete
MSKRLDFNKRNTLKRTVENRAILDNESKLGNQTREEMLEKLQKYRLVNDDNNTKKWHRYININDGQLRGGGFIIKNEPSSPFIAFKNVSLGYTFSVQKEDIILFENKGVLISQEMTSLLRRLKRNDNENKKVIVYITSDNVLYRERTIVGLARISGGSKNGISNALRNGKNIYKNGYVFRLTKEEVDELEIEFPTIDKTPVNTDLAEIEDVLDLLF